MYLPKIYTCGVRDMRDTSPRLHSLMMIDGLPARRNCVNTYCKHREAEQYSEDESSDLREPISPGMYNRRDCLTFRR